MDRTSVELPAIEGGTPIREKYLIFSPPSLGEEEIQEVIDTLRSGWIGTGPKTAQFAKDFREYVGAKFSTPTNSCTSALHLALAASGVGPGDEVITTAMTFAATANVVIHQGAKPVFVDIEPKGFLIDWRKIEKKITKKTKALIPVHYAGLPCDLDPIAALTKKYNLSLIEDAAHAAGTEYKGRRIGSIGDFSCFSFYVTKNMTTSEGGMVTTNHEEKAKMVQTMSLHGLSLDAWQRYSTSGFKHYDVIYPGYKYNMTDIAASMGLHQLKRLDKFIETRTRYAAIYQAGLKDLEPIILPGDNGLGRHAWHLYSIIVRPELLKITRDQLITALHKENIGVGVHYKAVHLHQYYRDTFGYKRGDFPNAENVSDNQLSLPFSCQLTESDIQDAIQALRKVINYYKK